MQSLPPVQPLLLSQQPLEYLLRGYIPGSIPSSRPCETVRTLNGKKCIVAGCQDRVTCPNHGAFTYDTPYQRPFPWCCWLEEQVLHCCASSHQLVVNSRSSSHSQRCKGRALPTPNPMVTPSPISCSQNQPNLNLPTFEEVCQLTLPTLGFVPKKSKASFARVLSATLRQVLLENSEQAWPKLFRFPKCVYPHVNAEDAMTCLLQ